MDEDWKPYFQSRMDEIIKKVTNEGINTIVVTAGPYRPYGAAINCIDPYARVIGIDWYSALRTGFGNVSNEDIIQSLNTSEWDWIINPASANRVIEYFLSCKLVEEHFKAFEKFVTVQTSGKYNMYTESEQAAKEAGLSYVGYQTIMCLYKRLDAARPEIRIKIEKEEYLKELENKL